MRIDMTISLDAIIYLGIFFVNFMTGLFAWRTHRIARQNRADIRRIEEQTNSMKDELVAATKVVSYAEGHAAGLHAQTKDLLVQATKEASYAAGREDGRNEASPPKG